MSGVPALFVRPLAANVSDMSGKSGSFIFVSRIEPHALTRWHPLPAAEKQWFAVNTNSPLNSPQEAHNKQSKGDELDIFNPSGRALNLHEKPLTHASAPGPESTVQQLSSSTQSRQHGSSQIHLQNSRLSDAFVFSVSAALHPKLQNAQGKWSSGSVQRSGSSSSSRPRPGLVLSGSRIQSSRSESSGSSSGNNTYSSGNSWVAAAASTTGAGPLMNSVQQTAMQVLDRSLFVELLYVSGGSELEAPVSVGAAVIPLFWLTDEQSHDEWLALTPSGDVALPPSVSADAGSINAHLVELARTSRASATAYVRLKLQYLFSRNTDFGASLVLSDSTLKIRALLDILVDGLNDAIPLQPRRPSEPRKPRLPLALCGAVDAADVDKIANALVACFDYQNASLSLLQVFIEEEVFAVCEQASEKSNAAGVLFRGNSIAVKMASRHARKAGQQYLDTVITPLVREVVSDTRSCELDPTRLVGVAKEDIKSILDSNAKHLRKLADRFLERIIQSIASVPDHVRRVCGIFRFTIERAANTTGRLPTNYWRTAVGGFFFLRFVCPAISASEIASSTLQRRNLVLVTKCLQNLASGVGFSEANKEPWMAPLAPFVNENSDRLGRFFHELTASHGEAISVAHVPSANTCLESLHILTRPIKVHRPALARCLSEELIAKVDGIVDHIADFRIDSFIPFDVPADFLKEKGVVQLSFTGDCAKALVLGLPVKMLSTESESAVGVPKRGLLGIGKQKVKEKVKVTILNDVAVPKLKSRATRKRLAMSVKPSSKSLANLSAESAASVSIELAARFFALYSRYGFDRRTAEGRAFVTKWADLKASSEYARALTVSKRLKHVFKGPPLPSVAERKAFFLNIFNAMVLHLCCHEGKSLEALCVVQPVSVIFHQFAYDIGGVRYSLFDIFHGILRANANLGEDSKPVLLDARAGMSLPLPLDPRMHFAVTLFTESSPAFQVFHPDVVEDQLQRAACLRCSQQVEILTSPTPVIALPPEMREYTRDFALGADTSRDPNAATKSMLVGLYPHVDSSVKAKISEIIADDDQQVISGPRSTSLVSFHPSSIKPRASVAGIFASMFSNENPDVDDPQLLALKRGDVRVTLTQLSAVESARTTRANRGTIVVVADMNSASLEANAAGLEVDEAHITTGNSAGEVSDIAEEVLSRLLEALDKSHIDIFREIRNIKVEVLQPPADIAGPVRQQKLLMYAQILQHVSRTLNEVTEFLASSDEVRFEAETFVPSEAILASEFSPSTVQRLESTLDHTCDTIARQVISFKREIWGKYSANLANQGVTDDIVIGAGAVGAATRAISHALLFRQFEVEES